MELYIQIRDGQPYEHPIFADNFRAAFPEVDTNNLPKDKFARFIRVEIPEIGDFEIYEGVTYEWDGDIVKDVHSIRPMTDEERATKQLAIDTMRVSIILETRKEQCRTEISSLSDEPQKQLWIDCLTAHELWVMETPSPITPPFPLFPIKDENGNWVPRN